ncbi:MAG TPA: class I SAM-dependent methyltransferase [Chloroflexota bacterium]|nr:class I SAM-dependent methyltransferase [Chloroflexota bacterium]
MSARAGASSAAVRWGEQLRAWAIPPEILAAAPESPWGFPPELFARRAELAEGEMTFSNLRALEALPVHGSVLDVGCGAGAASVPLLSKAGRITGVDSSADMLAAFRKQMDRRGAVTTVQGAWPDVASQTPAADVVVCHHVAYNVPDLASFARKLTDHAGVRVVMELTARHPMSRLNDLWLHFHGLRRPDGPTADDAVAVLTELGYAVERQDWDSSSLGSLGRFTSPDELSAWLRRRLCLAADRDREIWSAVATTVVERDGAYSLPPLPVVTLWWPGTAV